MSNSKHGDIHIKFAIMEYKTRYDNYKRLGEAMAEQKYNRITMTERTIKILDLLYKSDKGLNVSEISNYLDIPLANVFRILTSLVDYGFAEKDEVSNIYTLGMMFIPYAEKKKEKNTIATLADKYMKKLSNCIGETVNLGVLSNDQVYIVHYIRGERSIIASNLVPNSPLYCSSMGKIYLSHMGEEEMESYYKNAKLKKMTVNTITSIEEFKKQKKDIIKTNLSYDIEEYEYGLGCISSGIFNFKDNLIAAIGIIGPLSRINIKGTEDLSEKIKNTAKDISNCLKEHRIEEINMF